MGKGPENLLSGMRTPRCSKDKNLFRVCGVRLTFLFRSAGLEERPNSGSWGTGDQNSSSFDPSRVRRPARPEILSFPFSGEGASMRKRRHRAGKSDALLVCKDLGSDMWIQVLTWALNKHACFLSLFP